MVIRITLGWRVGLSASTIVAPFHNLGMRSNRSIPDATVIPELAYADLIPAARWLCDAFGFQG